MRSPPEMTRYEREQYRATQALKWVIPLTAVLFYFVVAANVWAWRNPKANQMMIWREFGSVVTFKKLEKYQ